MASPRQAGDMGFTPGPGRAHTLPIRLGDGVCVLDPGRCECRRKESGVLGFPSRRGLTPRGLRTMHGGGSATSCCAFTHRVAFEEGSGHLAEQTQFSVLSPGLLVGTLAQLNNFLQIGRAHV